MKGTVKFFNDMKGFVGHIGGDDFVAVTAGRDMDFLCSLLTDRFDNEIRQFHDDETIMKGSYECRDRNGDLNSFSLLSLSIAVVCTCKNHFKSYAELTLNFLIQNPVMMICLILSADSKLELSDRFPFFWTW